jgi:hypothetical protein
MKANNDQFENLRRALALKRHEQPPPRFFNDFSSQVIGRIRAGDKGDAAGVTQFFWEVPWLQRFWTALEAKPLLSGSFAVAVCGMLVAGVVYSEKTDPVAARFGESTQSPSTMMAIADGANPGVGALVDQPTFTPGAEPSGINPLVNTQPRASIFSDIEHRPQPQLIKFSPSGNN